MRSCDTSIDNTIWQGLANEHRYICVDFRNSTLCLSSIVSEEVRTSNSYWMDFFNFLLHSVQLEWTSF